MHEKLPAGIRTGTNWWNMTTKEKFLHDADRWICDGYSIQSSYFALMKGEDASLSSATIFMVPSRLAKSMPADSFRIKAAELIAESSWSKGLRRDLLIKALVRLVDGDFSYLKSGLSFNDITDRSYYSEPARPDIWFYDLNLRISGNVTALDRFHGIDFFKIDDALRMNDIPFDGMHDLSTYTGLRSPDLLHENPIVNIRILPPVDLVISDSSLEKNKLTIRILAETSFDESKVSVGIRVFPGHGIEGRKQISSEISWEEVDGLKNGVCELELKSADNVLTMLMIDGRTVRRQWFVDPLKARNTRFASTQLFDRDLRMIRQYVAKGTDSDKFENSVSSIFFMLGFSSAVQVETDAPDIIMVSPKGVHILVECTAKISDVSAKIGKLVNRRAVLSELFVDSGHPVGLFSILVCAAARSQISNVSEFSANEVVLIAREDIQELIDMARFVQDADKILDEMRARLTTFNLLTGDGAR